MKAYKIVLAKIRSLSSKELHDLITYDIIGGFPPRPVRRVAEKLVSRANFCTHKAEMRWNNGGKQAAEKRLASVAVASAYYRVLVGDIDYYLQHRDN